MAGEGGCGGGVAVDEVVCDDRGDEGEGSAIQAFYSMMQSDRSV